MSYQRRACIRIPTDFKAQLITGQGEIIPSKITNLSVTGFQLMCDKVFPKDESFVLRICLPKQTESFDLEVKSIRTRNLSEERSDFACSLGMQIINPPEAWILYAGDWIQAQLGSHTKRQIACGLMIFMAAMLGAKTIFSALGLQTLDLSLSEFVGLVPFESSLLGHIYILAGVFLTALMFFCGLQVLHPSIRDGFFFTSTAAIGVMTCYAPRLLLKLSLLQHSRHQKILYLFDLGVFILGLAGAIWARRLENRHQHLIYILERENIYPPLQKITGLNKPV